CGECYKKIVFSEDKLLRAASPDIAKGCDAAVSVCRYTGIVKHSLVKYKFYNKPGYYRTYAKLLTKHIFKVTNSTKFDMIISVPLHRNREIKRGYNQALLISKALGRETGIRECSKLLVRTRDTGAQSLLDRESRLVNVKDAFRITNAELIKGKNILLIDDILTTGTTVNECARTLKKAGANTVTAAVIASGQAV
ncbi:MAG: ComF family protein, partial [Ruminiclostridium sp.]|nr:ComF family protein [Ruminiclostridium sp.]